MPAPSPGSVAAVGAAALASGLLVATAPAAGAAPSCGPTGTVAQQAARADVVLAGTVTEVVRTRTDPRRAQATWTVEVERVWQGSVARDVVELSAPTPPRRCGLPVTAGRSYVVFALADGSALSSNLSLGTAPATDALVAEVESALGEGRTVGAPVEPAPPVATPVDDSPPPDFGRTAAPGAALALAGLLGLLVVRRRSR